MSTPSTGSAETPRAVIYARISQADSNVPAIANQEQHCRALAEREGYEVLEVFSDDGKSAYKAGITRDGFVALIERVQQGGVDVVLAVAQDRLARDEQARVAFTAVCASANVKWHFSDGGKVDPSTAEGGLIAGVVGALAQYESAVKRERIRRSVADRLSKGKDIGGPRPFGWEVDRLTERKVEADLLRDAYDGILDGKSLSSIAADWNASGVTRDRVKGDASKAPGWRPQTVRNALLRERNAGRLVVKGVTYAEDRPKIVEPEIFNDVKAILTNPSRAPKRGPAGAWTASGTLRCACGSYLATAYYKAKHAGGSAFMRCSPDSRPQDKRGKDARHVSMRAKPLERELSQHVEMELLVRMNDPEPLAVGPVGIPAMRLSIATLVAERDHVQQVAMLPGANLTMAAKRLQQLAEEIEKEQAALDARLAADVASRAMDAAQSLLGDWNDDTVTWDDFWTALPVEDRRELVRTVLPGAVLLPAAQAWGQGWRVAWENMP